MLIKSQNKPNFILIWPPKVREAIVLAVTVTYSYDDLNRMTQASATAVASGQSPYTQTFTYNAVGNLTSGPVGAYVYSGNTGSNWANPHAATSINSVTNTYDHDGNVLTDGTLTNTWNYKDQLTETTNGTFTRDYKYDENGNRVSSDDSTTITVYPNKYYMYDGTTKTKDIYAGDTLVATVTTVGSTVTPYYVHTDHLGSTNVTSDSSGAQVDLYDYFPYGNTRISTGSPSNQRQFLGQKFDSDTLYSYLQARYLQSSVGRFISQDPMFWQLPQELLLDPQQQNSYSYSRDNPITNSDPTGNMTVGEAVRSINNWLMQLFNSQQSASSNSVQSNSMQNGSTSVLSPNSWKTQMPDKNGCMDACSQMVGYHPDLSNSINVAGYDSAKNLNILPSAKEGVQTIDNYLSNGQPITVGVNRDPGRESGNDNKSTQHYIVIQSSGFDSNGNKYYGFYDPGTSRREAGTSSNNRLYLNTSNYSLFGTSEYNHKNYTVTEVRPK